MMRVVVFASLLVTVSAREYLYVNDDVDVYLSDTGHCYSRTYVKDFPVGSEWATSTYPYGCNLYLCKEHKLFLNFVYIRLPCPDFKIGEGCVKVPGNDNEVYPGCCPRPNCCPKPTTTTPKPKVDIDANVPGLNPGYANPASWNDICEE